MIRAVLPLILALVSTTGTAIATVSPHFVVNDPYCETRIGLGSGFSLPLLGGVNVTPITTADGETGSFVTCGVVDSYFFLNQYFAAEAAGKYIVAGKIGVMRGYAFGDAFIYPLSYGPPFVIATNPYNASAGLGSSSFFVDIVTPPPTSATPNAGQATSLNLKPILDADCTRYTVEPGTNAFVVVSFYSPDQYPDDGNPGTPIYTTHLLNINETLGVAVCPVDIPARVVSGLTVGQPVVMRVDFGISSGAYIDQFQAPSGFYGELSVLSTATAILTTTDGDPVVGASGHAYTTVDPIPDLPPPDAVTSTTEPVSTTTTTLPGCGGMCGNGTVDAACGEACDCPPTADPVMAGFGCTGSDVVPSQQSCVLCRGCRLLSFCGSTTGGTSTTTSTTLASSGSTTTTVPTGACDALAGFAALQCICTGGVAPATCTGDHVPAAIGKLFHRACTLVQRASTLDKTKKVKKDVHAAAVGFGKARTKVTKAAAVKKHPLSSGCGVALATILDEARQRSEGIGAGL